MKTLVRAASLAFVLFSGAAAVAEPASPEAIRSAADEFDQGRDAYQAGDYATSADHFEAADAQVPSAKALQSAIHSRRKAGQMDRAATLAELALRRHPDDAKLKALAESVLAETAEELHRLAVSCDKPCNLAVGAAAVYGRPATERVVYLVPGEHRVGASWEGGAGKAQVVLADAGGDGRVQFVRPGGGASAEPSETGDEDVGDDWASEDEGGGTGDDPRKDDGGDGASAGLSPTPFWIFGGLTVVAAGVTTWSYLDLLKNPGKDTVERECAGLYEDCYYWDQAKKSELRTNVLLGATAALGVTTVILGVLTDFGRGGDTSAGKESEARGYDVEPWVAIGSTTALGASGRF